MFWNRYTIIFSLILVSLISNGCGRRIYSKSYLLMNTLVEIKVIEKDKEFAYKAIEEAYKEMCRVVNLMNNYDEKSEISKLNKEGKRVNVSNELMELILESLKFSKLTKGAFDITVSPLFKCWNFNREFFHIPSKEEISKTLKKVGYENIKVFPEKRKIVLKNGVRLDLGGVAKGYVVKKACLKLKSLGIKNALVNAGGDIQVIGSSFGQPWKIGIQDPRNKERIIKIIKIKDMAVATSGDYEKYFIHNGIRYHHLLDPHTGYPARECISVTIIAPDAFLADILSTSVFVMGVREGLRLVERLDKIEAFIITSEKNFQSSGFKKYLG